MHTKRLLKLADYLEDVPRRRFKMYTWVEGQFCGRPNERKHSCGTAACAVGWACTIPSFKREGLRFNRSSSLPMFGNLDSWDAVDAFFKLDWSESTHLFASHAYQDEKGKEYNPTPKQVAKRIRKFVKTGVVDE